MSKVFLIDDDYATEILVENLGFRGLDVTRISTAEDALSRIDEIAKADLVILDIIMEKPDGELDESISGDRTTGMRVFTAVRAANPAVPILVFSATNDGDVVNALADAENTEFLSKWSCPSSSDFYAVVDRLLGKETSAPALRPFIVHGHDNETKWSVKNYLQNNLGLPEPIILHEQPNLGRTIIEKFEAYAALSDIVFVLLTPDDKGSKADDSNSDKRRARQNVIFELGFFLGALGRLSGRVFLLHKGPLELPTDIAGVIYIDISNGVEAAGEEIRKELSVVQRA